jgi:PHD/YefM family antitoxin component YafN of YafNO toxin-antitoxin module
MRFSIEDSILPLSELRSDVGKVKAKLKKSPVVITNNGRPDFGVCDLETLEIAIQVKELRDLLKDRWSRREESESAESAFNRLSSGLHASKK